jgi:hypothetical protein
LSSPFSAQLKGLNKYPRIADTLRAAQITQQIDPLRGFYAVRVVAGDQMRQPMAAKQIVVIPARAWSPIGQSCEEAGAGIRCA